jgi:hypothetical protein
MIKGIADATPPGEKHVPDEATTRPEAESI